MLVAQVIKAPNIAPKAVSIKKCSDKYMRLYATMQERVNHIATCCFDLENKEKHTPSENAVAACPEGKEK
ncbi:MAG: hypothetical protein HC896_08290 [Bacteroidales bacterium]|nr:hypothetical protein [Bacteroidales bacterium]